jgi:hypothetical protein
MKNIHVLEELHRKFCTGIRNKKAEAPRTFLKEKGLDFNELNIGFNSGQFWHRKDETFRQKYIDAGVLSESDAPVRRSSMTAYSCFGVYSVVFPLKNERGDIVNMYSIRIKGKPGRTEFLYTDSGLYPCYPSTQTNRLFITKDILSAASILQAKALRNQDAVLALHDGRVCDEHLLVISELKELSEIILLGINEQSVEEELRKMVAHVQIRFAPIPEDKTLNEFILKNDSKALCGLLNGMEDLTSANSYDSQIRNVIGELQVIHPEKLIYNGELGTYYVLGNLPTSLSQMKVTLHFEEQFRKRKYRTKIDLYDFDQVSDTCREISEKENVSLEMLQSEMLILTELLEKHREKLFENLYAPRKNNTEKFRLTAEKEKQAIEFLQAPNPVERINELIGQSGIVGEEQTRMMLFIIASTYKMPSTLHALVQGVSGSGKSHLINAIAKCFPEEDIFNMTRVSSKSFYHLGTEELVNKLITIQDYDGLDDVAQFAFRELQSNGQTVSLIPIKDKYGQHYSGIKTVNGHFASLIATTRAEVYADNMSRSLVLGVDESMEQTLRIINQQNNALAGQIDSASEHNARQQLQNIIRVLKPYTVINPFANQLHLPIQAQMLRRLNSHFQSAVVQITLLHQFQRRKDEQGRLITEPEDIRLACDIFFPSILLKVDELDSSLRQFFEQLKDHVQKAGTSNRFTQRQIRSALNISKTLLSIYMKALKNMEYIQIVDGSSNKGFYYQIVFWDSAKQLKEKIQQQLDSQISKLA